MYGSSVKHRNDLKTGRFLFPVNKACGLCRFKSCTNLCASGGGVERDPIASCIQGTCSCKSIIFLFISSCNWHILYQLLDRRICNDMLT